MQYMVVEHFRDGNPVPVYRRFREQGSDGAGRTCGM